MTKEIDWESLYRELEDTLRYIFIGFAESLEMQQSNTTPPALEIVEVSVDTAGSSASVITTSRGPAAEFAFYVYRDSKRVATIAYGPANSTSVSTDVPGVYRIRAFARSVGQRTKPDVVEKTVRFERP